ncbi:hypothetical protein HN51_017892, partial [Arachis hypogaea]
MHIHKSHINTFTRSIHPHPRWGFLPYTARTWGMMLQHHLIAAISLYVRALSLSLGVFRSNRQRVPSYTPRVGPCFFQWNVLSHSLVCRGSYDIM